MPLSSALIFRSVRPTVSAPIAAKASKGLATMLAVWAVILASFWATRNTLTNRSAMFHHVKGITSLREHLGHCLHRRLQEHDPRAHNGVAPPPLPPPPPRPPPPFTPPKCLVPKVVGAKLAKAKPRIRRARCRVGKITRKHSSKARRGRALSQRPKAGCRQATRLSRAAGRRPQVSRGGRPRRPAPYWHTC
jgi:hypothetical protein